MTDAPPFPRATWRLILEPTPLPGARNLATDEAILAAVAAGEAPATLRLYAWAPPALVLGRGQPLGDVDADAVRAAGCDLLRRITGGTAVLHDQHALSYSVAVPEGEPRLRGGIVESYRGLGAAWLRALQALGLRHAQSEAQERARSLDRARSSDRARPPGRARSPVCFELPSDYEVTVGGRKLVGNAQRRVRGGILQHGTLPLAGDLARISELLAAKPPPARIRRHALTLAQALGHAPSWQSAARALIEGCAQALNLDLEPAPLLPQERAEVERLVEEKYATVAWTNEGSVKI